MTNPCKNCDIEEKVHVCCGRYPETGKRAAVQTEKHRVVMACVYLDASGMCTIYNKRPHQCRRFFCERFNTSEPGFFFFSSP